MNRSRAGIKGIIISVSLSSYQELSPDGRVAFPSDSHYPRTNLWWQHGS